MDRKQIFDWVQSRYGAEPEYPWNDENAVLRHSSNKKWFALFIEVPRFRVGLEGQGNIDLMNLKCSELLLGSLLQQGFLPAYHMSKAKWISVRLDGTADEEQIKFLIKKATT